MPKLALEIALRLLRPSWYLAIAAPLCMGVEVFTTLTQPRMVRRIIDVGIAHGDASVVLSTGAAMIGLTAIGMLGGLGCLFASVTVVQRFGRDLRALLFRRVQALSFSQLDRLQTGGLVTRITNDVTQIQEALTMVLRHGVRIVTTLFGSVILAAVTSPRLAVISLFVIPVVFGILSLVIRRAYPTYGRVQAKLDALNGVLKENLAGARVVRAFARAQFEQARFGGVSDELAARNVTAARLGATTVPLASLALNAGIVAALWLGGAYVSRGNLQVGQVVAFIAYLTQTLATLMMTSMLTMQASRAQVSIRRVMDVLDLPGERVTASAPSCPRAAGPRGAVAFENVSFSYDPLGRDPVLQDVSFSIGAGQKLAVLGATGAGKTSLVHLVPGFHRPTAGRITLDGVDIANLDEAELRRAVAVVMQETVLFSGTIADNIRWGRPEATLEEVVAAAEAAQALEFIRCLPEGFSTPVHRGGVNLSGGQRQRIAIARALLVDAPVLVLDDATSALDQATQLRLQGTLARHAAGQTRIVVTQFVRAIRDADAIIVLDNGRVAGAGTYEELMASCALFREIHDSQTQRVSHHGGIGKLQPVN